MLLHYFRRMVFCVTGKLLHVLFLTLPALCLMSEFTQILFMWMILLGGVYTAGVKKHLAIDLLAQKLPAASVLTLGYFIQIIITVFAVIFMIYGGNMLLKKHNMLDKSLLY